MHAIRKRLVTDEQMRPIAVQIEYADWLEIERALVLDESRQDTDLSRFHGVLTLTEDPLAFQERIRSEWS
jgi:hypothetical protein